MRSSAHARMAAAPASTKGHGGDLSGVTKVYVRGDCGKYGWVLSGGEAPLSWWFSVGVVSALAISVDSSLTGWVKIAAGCTMELISSSDNSCINSSPQIVVK